MKTTLLITIALLGACANNDAITKGEATRAMIGAYCEVAEFEFGTGEAWEGRCVDHFYFHTCELDDSCGVSMADGAEEALDACVEAIYSGGMQCDYFGLYCFMPLECSDIWERIFSL